jgi:F0F1-type ATP synthase delta subunit
MSSLKFSAKGNPSLDKQEQALSEGLKEFFASPSVRAWTKEEYIREVLKGTRPYGQRDMIEITVEDEEITTEQIKQARNEIYRRMGIDPGAGW